MDITGELRAATLMYGVQVIRVPNVRAPLPGPDMPVAGNAPHPGDEEYRQQGKRQSDHYANRRDQESPTTPSEVSCRGEG